MKYLRYIRDNRKKRNLYVKRISITRGGFTYPSLLRNETYMKVGEALCLEIRRKDSRNEAQRMDQYEGSYVVRLLLLCLSLSHLTFLLFLISFFHSDPLFLLASSSRFSVSLPLCQFIFLFSTFFFLFSSSISLNLSLRELDVHEDEGG